MDKYAKPFMLSSGGGGGGGGGGGWNKEKTSDMTALMFMQTQCILCIKRAAHLKLALKTVHAVL